MNLLNKHRRSLVVGGILIFLLIAAGIVRQSASSPNKTGSTSNSKLSSNVAESGYKYDKLDNYTMSSPPAGAKISLQKPIELKKAESNQTTEKLVHSTNIDNQDTGVSRLWLASIATTSDNSDQYIATFNRQLFDKNDKRHGVFINSFYKYALTHSPQGWSIKISDPRVFNNQTIKSGAWIFDYSASDPNNADKALKGQIVYAITPNSRNTYFIMASSEVSDWNTNKLVWDNVFNSIKLNQ